MTPSLLVPDKTTWIVVANEASAAVYTRTAPKKPPVRLMSLENEDARRKTDELVSDSGGRSFDSHGQGRHTMTKEKSGPKQHSARVFAKTIATRIEKAVHDGSADEFVLIAAPRFLGELRDALGKLAPARTIDKDIVGHGVDEIARLLET